MKDYEKPIAEVVDFSAEQIMADIGGGISGVEEGGGGLPGM